MRSRGQASDELLGRVATVLIERDGQADLVVADRVEHAQGLRHGDKVDRAVLIEVRLAERGGLEQTPLPMHAQLTTGRVDADVHGLDEVGADESEQLVGLGRALLELLGRVEEDGRR